MSSKKKPSNPKEAAFVKEKNDNTKKAASGVTVDSAVKRLTDVQLAIGKQLADIAQQVSAEVETLRTVKEAVKLETEELARIHDVGLLAKEYEQVVAEFEEQKQLKVFETNNFIADLESQQISSKKDFERLTEDLSVERERDENQYSYEFSQKKLNDQLAWDEVQRLNQNNARDKQEALERLWKAREETITKNEAEFASFKKQVEEFPAVLKAEVGKEVGITTSRIEREYKHQIELLTKDSTTARQIADSTIKNLNDVVAKLSMQLESANLRIAESDKKVQSIAEKALESAGGQRTLSELQTLQNNQNGSGRKQA